MSTQVTPGVRSTPFTPIQPLPLAEDDVNLAQLTSFVRRHRNLFAVCIVAACVVTMSLAMLWPRYYTSTASFIPQGRSQMSSLASLASQFGVSVPLSDPGRSPGFYAALLLSKNVMATVVERRYPAPSARSADSVTLIEYLRVGGTTPDLRREAAMAKLKRKMVVGQDQKAGTVVLEVRLHDAVMARNVARAFIAEVDSFNVKSRQSQASSERRFTERRLAEAKAEARQADDELQAFLQRNRDFRTSPQLAFTYDRLVDNVTLRQQIYTTLAQAYEQARIEEVRDTPVITVVESPMTPAHPDPRPFGRALAGGLLLGLVAARILGVRRDRRAATA